MDSVLGILLRNSDSEILI